MHIHNTHTQTFFFYFSSFNTLAFFVPWITFLLFFFNFFYRFSFFRSESVNGFTLESPGFELNKTLRSCAPPSPAKITPNTNNNITVLHTINQCNRIDSSDQEPQFISAHRSRLSSRFYTLIPGQKMKKLK